MFWLEQSLKNPEENHKFTGYLLNTSISFTSFYRHFMADQRCQITTPRKKSSVLLQEQYLQDENSCCTVKNE